MTLCLPNQPAVSTMSEFVSVFSSCSLETIAQHRDQIVGWLRAHRTDPVFAGHLGRCEGEADVVVFRRSLLKASKLCCLRAENIYLWSVDDAPSAGIN